ncbi:MAG: hypothetical protein ACR2P0_02890 [Acidimicrobiales bacterium]
MNRPDGGDDRRRTALVALAHPASVLCLAGWILNDHLLKSTLGNPITGKLSDAFGMVLFPLLVAATIERWTDRAVEVGMAAAVVTMTVLNTSHAVSNAAERGFEVIWSTAQLTVDPTDLLVLPLVVLPWKLWRRAEASAPIAPAWGRAVFAAGAVACLATSSPEPVSEQSFEGSFVLTEANPEVSIGVSVTMGGESASVDRVQTRYEAVHFGAGSSARGNEPAIEVIPDDEMGTITFRLAEPALAPTRVEWNMIAIGDEGDICLPFCLGGGDDEVLPVFEADVPREATGAASRAVPIATWSIAPTEGSERPVSAHAFAVTVPPGIDSTEILLVADPFRDDVVQIAATELNTFDLSADRAYYAVETRAHRVAPPSCTDGCTFEVWVGADTNRIYVGEQMGVHIYAPDGVIVEMADVVLLPTRTERTVRTPDVNDDQTLEAVVEFTPPEPSADPLHKAAEWVVLSLENDARGIDLSGPASANWPAGRVLRAEQCCASYALVVSDVPDGDSPPDEARLVLEYWAPETLTSKDALITVGPFTLFDG